MWSVGKSCSADRDLESGSGKDVVIFIFAMLCMPQVWLYPYSLRREQTGCRPAGQEPSVAHKLIPDAGRRSQRTACSVKPWAAGRGDHMLLLPFLPVIFHSPSPCRWRISMSLTFLPTATTNKTSKSYTSQFVLPPAGSVSEPVFGILSASSTQWLYFPLPISDFFFLLPHLNPRCKKQGSGGIKKKKKKALLRNDVCFSSTTSFLGVLPLSTCSEGFLTSC